MIRGVLFDKDGTLIDIIRTWLQPYQQAAEFLAMEMRRPALATQLLRSGGYIAESDGDGHGAVARGRWVRDSPLASGSNEQIMTLWAEEIGQPLRAHQRQTIRTIFARAAHQQVPVIANIDRWAADLHARGLCLGLATMDDEAHAHRALEKLQLTDYFDFVCGADSGFGLKPEPGMVAAFCTECKLVANEVIMVGDSPKDLLMGKNAGVALSVGVLTGAHTRVELARDGDRVLADIGALATLLDEL